MNTHQPPQNKCKHGVAHPEGHQACDGCCTPATPDWEKEIRKACGWEANDEEIIVIIRNLLTQSRLQYQKELVEKIHGEAYYEDRRRHVVLLSDVLEILKD